MSLLRFQIVTAAAPGPIAVIQLHGEGTGDVIRALSGRDVPPGRSALLKLGDIDEAVVARLDNSWVQIMPHGGPRISQRLVQRLGELGAEAVETTPPRELYPEASSELEADMLSALALAASPAAIDLLVEQPRLWREHLERRGVGQRWPAVRDARNHLIHAPLVVLVGRPNVGKSTLTNMVMGRAASIAADLPGTTRDWVAGLAELPGAAGAVAVQWFDTPGLRDSVDPIERRAIELAFNVIRRADVLIAMRDPECGWPAGLEREPDVRVLNKCDTLGQAARAAQPAGEIQIAARTGEGVEELAAGVSRALGLETADLQEPWVFSPALRKIVGDRDAAALRRYCGPLPGG